LLNFFIEQPSPARVAVVTFLLKLDMYSKSKITNMKSQSYRHMSHLLSEELTPTALSRLYDQVKYTACIDICQYFGKDKNKLPICIDKSEAIGYNVTVEATV